jgi:hypothetical protein
MADIKRHQHPSDEAEDKSAGTPLQPDPDRVAEQDHHHGDDDQGQDHGMGSEAFHRSAPPSMGVHNSGL